MPRILFRNAHCKAVEFTNSDPAELLKDMAWYIKNMKDSRFIDIRFEVQTEDWDSNPWVYYGCIYYDYDFENWQEIEEQR